MLDNRLYDLIPGQDVFRAGLTPIAYETLGVGGERGDALGRPLGIDEGLLPIAGDWSLRAAGRSSP